MQKLFQTKKDDAGERKRGIMVMLLLLLLLLLLSLLLEVQTSH